MSRFLLLIVLVFSFKGSSQSLDSIPKQDTRWQMFTYDVGTMFTAVGHSYTRPLHWGGKQWSQFGLVAGGTGLFYLFDEDSSRFFRNRQEDVPSFIREYGEFYGNPENNYLATGGVYLAGLITKNEKLRRTGVLLVASATSAGFLQQVLKSVVGRTRPVAGLGKDTFDPFNSNRNFHSFPSGHALLAFTNAYAIGKQFKNPWVKGGIYLLGAIPGISRVWDGQHWLSDVIFAYALSIATVESIDRYLDKKYAEKYNAQQKEVSWNLNFGINTVGVTARF
ncbi:hypothetical protein MTsPCn5_17830 [Croceitalea sp. MTPC5]|uniref:phosphatase PAP2 family protein n=1 Tax=Croceitalea sp. MTPC5 TaxID=3056565 RepID=UPI002B363DA4|nr:hypothetical protein MTsPCn5_17830 [Croceitalea sp. MTPC5]